MKNSGQCPFQISKDWKESPCPALRPLAGEPGTKIPYDALRDYFKHEIGVSGIMLLALMRHVKDIGDKDGIEASRLSQSFVLDSVFSGVTRNGTHREVLQSIYQLLDPQGEAGRRSYCMKDLPRLSALLRAAFPRRGILGIQRQVAVAMTTIEWGFLIHAFGTTVNGERRMDEQSHRKLLDGELPGEERNRDLRMMHVLAGAWRAFQGYFVRLDSASLASARTEIGARAIES